MSDRLTRPREALLGMWDRIVGPGATRAETIAMLIAMVASIGLAAWAALTLGPVHWQWWTWIVILVLASDLGGGLVANALPATQRWYHRPGGSARDHLGFAAMHIHAFVLAWLAPSALPWRAAIGLYCWMMASCLVVLLAPFPLRKAVAFALTALGTVFFGIRVPIASPLGWVAIVLLLKIVAGHMIGPERRDV
jgi:hypothetical protein